MFKLIYIENFLNKKSSVNSYLEASRGAAARSVTIKPTGCGFDPNTRR